MFEAANHTLISHCLCPFAAVILSNDKHKHIFLTTSLYIPIHLSAKAQIVTLETAVIGHRHKATYYGLTQWMEQHDKS